MPLERATLHLFGFSRDKSTSNAGRVDSFIINVKREQMGGAVRIT